MNDTFILLDDARANRARLYQNHCARILLPATRLDELDELLADGWARGLHATLRIPYEFGHALLGLDAPAAPLALDWYAALHPLHGEAIDAWLAAQDDGAPAGLADLHADSDAVTYAATIAAIHEELRAGNSYQINLTTRLLADRERIVLPDFRAELYNGSMEGGISMANTSPPTYHLQQYAKNINIRPLMQDLFRYGNISGEGDVEIDLTAQGADRAGLTKTLSGRLQLNLTKGNWLGINLDQALQSLLGNKPVNTDEHSATPFQRFSMSSTIRNGISSHENAELDSNRLHIVLTGSTDFNNMTLNERLLLSPADGKGTPIPLNIRGKADNPSITLDYKGLTEGLETAEEKQQALTSAIREQWQWLNRPSENGK